MTDLSPAIVMNRLLELEAEMALHQNDYEHAADDYERAKGEFDKAEARAYLEAEGPVEERKRTALLVCVKSGEYEQLIKAKALNEVQKRAIASRADRASQLQSVLRALTQERQTDVPQPAWRGQEVARG